MEKQILELNLSQIIEELRKLSSNSSEEVLLVLVTLTILVLVLVQRVWHCYKAYQKYHILDNQPVVGPVTQTLAQSTL